MRFLLYTVLFAGLATSAHAQKGQLSAGLTMTYYPSGVAGLGVALDYRWRLGPRFEAIGVLSANHFWNTKLERYEGPHFGLNDKFSYLYFGGLGLGYRTAPNGFHIGLLGGAARYAEVVNNRESSMMVRPAVALTMGHGIGERLDVSVDTWALKTKKGEFFALPMLKLTYKFGRKKR